MSQKENSLTKTNRKKAVAIWNRRLAWVTLVVLIIMNLTVYGDYFKWADGLRIPGTISSLMFILLLLIHSFFSVYLFGFPKFRWNVRVIHIYIGYMLFVTTWISQSISTEPYHIIFYTLNWIFIVAHVSLSIRFAVKRNIKKQPIQELSFYTGGKIFRDAE